MITTLEKLSEMVHEAGVGIPAVRRNSQNSLKSVASPSSSGSAGGSTRIAIGGGGGAAATSAALAPSGTATGGRKVSLTQTRGPPTLAMMVNGERLELKIMPGDDMTAKVTAFVAQHNISPTQIPVFEANLRKQINANAEAEAASASAAPAAASPSKFSLKIGGGAASGSSRTTGTAAAAPARKPSYMAGRSYNGQPAAGAKKGGISIGSIVKDPFETIRRERAKAEQKAQDMLKVS